MMVEEQISQSDAKLALFAINRQGRKRNYQIELKDKQV